MSKKTIVALLITVVIAAFLTACASGTTTDEATDSGETEAQTGLPNPWSDVASAEDAAKGAGIASFTVSDDLGLTETKVLAPTFRCMDGIAEADFDGEAFEVCVRKSETLTGQDLSGDYNEYPFEWTMEVDGMQVACRGYEEGLASAFDWERDGANYSVMFTSLENESMGVSSVEVAAVMASVS